VDLECDEFAEIPIAAQGAFTVVAEDVGEIPEERRPGRQAVEVALVREKIQMIVHEAVWPFDGGQQGGFVLDKQLGSRKFKRMVGRPADGGEIQSAQKRNVSKRNDGSGGEDGFIHLRTMPDEAMGGRRFRVFHGSREDDFRIVGTYVIVLPLPTGYFNVGDVFVLLSGWFLGPLYGSVAAAVGSSLADVISGYAIYAPATFIVKGLDAFISYLVWTFFKKFIKKEKFDFLPRVFAGILGELCMIVGYYLFESIFLVGFSGALASVLGNALQGGLCCIGATLLTSFLYPVKQIKNYFPLLSDPTLSPFSCSAV